MNLIDRDALLEELRKLHKWLAENSLSGELPFLQRDINIVKEQPTVDAEPVKHGKWVDAGRSLVCSCCGKAYNFAETNYCWYCGAKMDVDCEIDEEDIENTPTDVIPIEWIEKWLERYSYMNYRREIIEFMVTEWKHEQEKKDE